MAARNSLTVWPSRSTVVSVMTNPSTKVGADVILYARIGRRKLTQMGCSSSWQASCRTLICCRNSSCHCYLFTFGAEFVFLFRSPTQRPEHPYCKGEENLRRLSGKLLLARMARLQGADLPPSPRARNGGFAAAVFPGVVFAILRLI